MPKKADPFASRENFEANAVIANHELPICVIQKLFCPPLIVIGMHRSGTSMLSELLHASGIFMGNDWGRNQESEFFQAINIRLMKQSGFDWATPGVPIDSKPIELSFRGLSGGYVKTRRHPLQLIKLLSKSQWGWKDPRNTFTLDAWLKTFPDAKVIHIYRNGMDVALSLFHRNLKLGKGNKYYETILESKTAGLDLWEKYTAQAFSYEPLLGERMLTVQFEKIIACDRAEIDRLESFTGVPVRRQIETTADQSRKSRYMDSQHEDLVRYARQNGWMERLEYI
ncbi:MAG TPA: sulfotransferase [Verrucomicrobiae bacterium]